MDTDAHSDPATLLGLGALLHDVLRAPAPDAVVVPDTSAERQLVGV